MSTLSTSCCERSSFWSLPASNKAVKTSIMAWRKQYWSTAGSVKSSPLAICRKHLILTAEKAFKNHFACSLAWLQSCDDARSSMLRSRFEYNISNSSSTAWSWRRLLYTRYTPLACCTVQGTYEMLGVQRNSCGKTYHQHGNTLPMQSTQSKNALCNPAADFFNVGLNNGMHLKYVIYERGLSRDTGGVLAAFSKNGHFIMCDVVF